MHGLSEPEKWSRLKPCCLFLTRLMVRAQWEWTLFHLEQQFSWCTNIWHAHNRFAPFLVFRKAKPKSFPVLHPGEMRWRVMPPSCCAGTIKFAKFKLSSIQVNACNIPLNHVGLLGGFFVPLLSWLLKTLGEGTKLRIPALCSNSSSDSFHDTGPNTTSLCLHVHTFNWDNIWILVRSTSLAK